MAETPDEITLSILRRVSTASICTALFKKGLRNQFIQDVRPLSKPETNMVGPAYTLRYIPAREDRNGISVFENPEHPQRVAVEQCPQGHVMVIDSRNDPRAASAGSILITRLMVRGCAGVVTDGGFRDSPVIETLDIACYHNRPSAPTNLTLHEACDLNVPIGCGGVAVFPGDVVVGDGEGVVVIPAHMTAEIADECARMERFEHFATEQVLKGAPVIGLYPPTSESARQAFEAWLAERSDDRT